MVVVHHLVDVLEWHLPSKGKLVAFLKAEKKSPVAKVGVIYEGAFTSKFLAKCEVK